MFGISDPNPDLLFVSGIGKDFDQVEYWPAGNTRLLPQAGTVLESHAGTLFALTGNTITVIYFQRGDTVSQFLQVLLTRKVGCIAPKSATAGLRGVYFAGADGVYLVDAGGYVKISGEIQKTWDGIVEARLKEIAGGWANGNYWLSYSEEGTRNDRVMKYDERRSNPGITDVWFGPHDYGFSSMVVWEGEGDKSQITVGDPSDGFVYQVLTRTLDETLVEFKTKSDFKRGTLTNILIGGSSEDLPVVKIGRSSTIYEQDFDELNLGNLDSQDSWTVVSGTADIETPILPKETNDQCVGTTTNGTVFRRTITAQTGKFVYSFKTIWGDNGDDTKTGIDVTFRLKDGATTALSIIIKDGSFSIGNNTDGTAFERLCPSVWHTITLEVDVATDKYQIMIDGVIIGGSKATRDFDNAVAQIDTIDVEYAPVDIPSAFQYDDVDVFPRAATGTWLSPVIRVDANKLGNLVWNEREIRDSADLTWDTRTGAVDPVDGTWEAFKTGLSAPVRSQIMSTPNTFIQLRANFTAPTTFGSPELLRNPSLGDDSNSSLAASKVTLNDFVMSLSHSKVVKEDTIPFRYLSGSSHSLGPEYRNEFRRIIVHYKIRGGSYSLTTLVEGGGSDGTESIHDAFPLNKGDWGVVIISGYYFRTNG